MAHGPKKVDSVYDFLYVDARRIGVLLSQFGNDGVLTELTRATDASSETGGGIDIKLAKIETKEGEKSSLTRRFDPQWLTPLIFLDKANDILVRDISTARIGQLALVSGSLFISDLSTSRALWEIPFVKSLIAEGMSERNVELAGNRHERRGAQKTTSQNSNKSAILSQVGGMLDIIKALPHGIVASISQNDNQTIWCCLNSPSLIISSSELMLNHGSSVSGSWNAVCIIDALPDVQDDVPDAPSIGVIADVMKNVAPVARSLLGRPPSAYGVTPLMIFREIQGG